MGQHNGHLLQWRLLSQPKSCLKLALSIPVSSTIWSDLYHWKKGVGYNTQLAARCLHQPTPAKVSNTVMDIGMRLYVARTGQVCNDMHMATIAMTIDSFHVGINISDLTST